MNKQSNWEFSVNEVLQYSNLFVTSFQMIFSAIPKQGTSDSTQTERRSECWWWPTSASSKHWTATYSWGSLSITRLMSEIIRSSTQYGSCSISETRGVADGIDVNISFFSRAADDLANLSVIRQSATTIWRRKSTNVVTSAEWYLQTRAKDGA